MADIFSMEIVKKFGIIVIVFLVAQSWLLAIPEFTLPVGTPGRQEQIDPLGQIQALTSYQNRQFCEDVHIPNTNCHLYFPIDGSQPSTQDAGLWSGAQYVGQLNDNEVTNWWVRVFGGNKAVNFSNVGQAQQPKEPKMGFANGFPEVIIKLGSAGLRQQFWRTFRDIAADPVGRVLLYRLFIEIRRRDNGTYEGCCGNDVILPIAYNLNRRNTCRSITIVSTNDGFAFDFYNHTIEFDLNVNITTSTLALNGNNELTTDEENRTYDIALFHEMLHWFHSLRNPNRFSNLDSDDPLEFKYPLRCYYGNINELCVWDATADAEDMATILGCPNLNIPNLLPLIANNAFFLHRNNHNDRPVHINGINQFIPIAETFLNGDDLSENVYRASQGQHMRFGHVTTEIEPVSYPRVPNRFNLAHEIVIECYRQITNGNLQNWRLIRGQAIQ